MSEDCNNNDYYNYYPIIDEVNNTYIEETYAYTNQHSTDQSVLLWGSSNIITDRNQYKKNTNKSTTDDNDSIKALIIIIIIIAALIGLAVVI